MKKQIKVSNGARRMVIAAAAFVGIYFMMPGEIFEFDIAQVTITNAQGLANDFVLEVAVSRRHRAVGLMFRSTISDDSGMIFVFPTTGYPRIWMKNTPLSLDIIFVDRNGIVQDVHPRARPNSEAIIASRALVAYAIELNGGASERLGINLGSRVAFTASQSMRFPLASADMGEPTASGLKTSQGAARRLRHIVEP